MSAVGRWLTRQYEWNKIFLSGKWKRNPTGRYLYFYSCRPIKDRFHEFALTESIWPYLPFAKVLRTAVDPMVRPDATLVMDGVTFNIELDRGTMQHLDRVRQRLLVHRGKCDWLLFVTTKTEQRVRNILDIGGEVRDILAVTTLDTLLRNKNNAWERIWQTADGRLLKIDRPEKRVEQWRSFSKSHGGSD